MGCTVAAFTLIGIMHCFVEEPALEQKLQRAQSELRKSDLDLIQVRSELSRMRAQPESVSTMTVRATEMAGTMMMCDGEPGAVHCAKYGAAWANYEGPIVTCLRGQCRLVRE